MLSSRPTEARLQAYAKTPGRENAQADRRLMMTGHGKQNLKQTQNPLGPQSVQPTRTKSLLVPGTEKTTTKSRPLGDKTPFPNRPATAFTTPLPGDTNGKLARLVLNPALQPQTEPGTTPASVARPSSARTHARAPRMSGSASKSTLFDNLNAGPPLETLQFQTPATNGRPWDVSPLAPSPIALPASLPEPEDDFDEIEYMPPKVDFEKEAWVPPFEFALPDYAEVGRRLRAGACAYPVDDDPGVKMDEWEMQGECAWEMPVVQLATLESDDPFHVISHAAQLPAPSKRPKINPAPLDLHAKLAHRPQARAQAPAAQTWAGAGPPKPRTTVGGPARSRTGTLTTTGTTIVVGKAKARTQTTTTTKTKAAAPAPPTSARARARAYTTSTTTAPPRAPTRPTAAAGSRPPKPPSKTATTTAAGGARPPGPMKVLPCVEAVGARAGTTSRVGGRPGTGSGSGSGPASTAVGRSRSATTTTTTTAGSRPAAAASTRPASTAALKRPAAAAREPDDIVSLALGGDADGEGLGEEFLFDV
ncbi:hypothetical protein C8R47DRAFT_1315656 [Mycena vitilis]|nr:hypothetical protein C8R47DRAFT_1315656 [Mycena vitilis]